MAKSWLDFYNILTADSKNTSRTRQDNFFKLDYTGTTGRLGSMGAAGKASTKAKEEHGFGYKLLNALTLNAFTGDNKTAGARIFDVMARLAYASANIADELIAGASKKARQDR